MDCNQGHLAYVVTTNIEPVPPYSAGIVSTRIIDFGICPDVTPMQAIAVVDTPSVVIRVARE